MEDIEDATSEKVLLWIQRMEAQRAMEMVLNNIKETKEFDFVRHNIPKYDSEAKNPTKRVKMQYCRTRHLLRQYPAYDKKCRECGRPNQFKAVSMSVCWQQMD